MRELGPPGAPSSCHLWAPWEAPGGPPGLLGLCTAVTLPQARAGAAGVVRLCRPCWASVGLALIRARNTLQKSICGFINFHSMALEHLSGPPDV